MYPDVVAFAHRVSESSLSPFPLGVVSVFTSPAPSMVPVPVMVRLLIPSPHSSALWKWLCPKSWYLAKALGSGGSKPLDAARMVAPLLSCRVTLLLK